MSKVAMFLLRKCLFGHPAATPHRRRLWVAVGIRAEAVRKNPAVGAQFVRIAA
jgi:hypothetical protein